jgi:sentrin-specific protease 8
MESRKDEKVLSYGDVVLRRSDLDLLAGPCYLNDRLIEFYFLYLSAKFAASCYAATPSSPLLLVSPAITFWLLHCPDSESLVASIVPLQLQDREVFLPSPLCFLMASESAALATSVFPESC